MSSDDSESSRANLRQVAKKSTAAPQQPPPPQSASSSKPNLRRMHWNSQKNLKNMSDRFLENFNPETSIREKRKLNRKINPPSTARRPPGAVYDENGIHVPSCSDLCDCLMEDCVGCFFECRKCGSSKCGVDCRVHRKYFYEQLEYHGYDITIKNPLFRS